MYRLKTLLFRVKQFVKQSHADGLSFRYIALVHLPRLFCTLAYNKVSKWINDRILSTTINLWLFSRFHQKHQNQIGGHYYVIVMPNTLHYLIPCLTLLPKEKSILLIFNGARGWEKRLIGEQFPNRPKFNLLTLPNSSINHGPLINLFFSVNDQNFGIIDHDLYIFDSTLLNQTRFTPNQSMRAVFKGINPISGMQYPHTFFLYFNTKILKKIMRRYGVDARIYRSPKKNVKYELAKVGLNNHCFIKEYMNYFDTLHVVLGLSYVQNFEVDYFETKQVFHLGGTSMGSQYSKDLLHMYMSMRFLEYLNNSTITVQYMRFLRPFSSSQQIWQKLTITPEVRHMRQMLDIILQNLHSDSEYSKK